MLLLIIKMKIVDLDDLGCHWQPYLLRA